MTNILLPHDVVIDILSRLPVKSLLRFRCVSKPWKNSFSDPSFINMHLKHSINNNNYEHLMLDGSSLCSIAAAANDQSNSSLADEVVEINDYPFPTYPDFPYSEVVILGSCNGLLLIHTSHFNNDNFIWNPSTKEFKKLPNLLIPMKPMYYCRMIEYGFGYDEITEDYKVVRIVLFDIYVDDDEEYDASVVYSKVDVYSLRSNSWRNIQEDAPYNLAKGGFTGRVLVNGALHCIAGNNNNTISDPWENVLYTIVSFNLGDEKYRVIEQPNYAADNDQFDMNLDVLGGCLCILCNFPQTRSEIWVMKDYGVKESWTKLFTISQPTVIRSFDCVRPIKFTKNGTEVVFQKNNKKSSCSSTKKDKNSLFVYDPKHGTAKTLQIRGLEDKVFETYTYVESLISLNSGTFVGQEQTTLLEQTRKVESKMNKRRPIHIKRRVFVRYPRRQARERL